jgi:hypothetical protein
MRKTSLLGLLFLALGTVTLLGFSKLQSSAIDRKQLRDMLTQLGYEVTDIVKDAGKEKYSATFQKSDLNIPVGFEISPSGSYIWLTVNLMDAPKEGSDKTLALLKQNGKIQPTFFYVTESGRLMAALAVENREVTNSVLRARIDSITDNIGKTKDVWQK